MKPIPYGKQTIDEEDIRAVVEVLKSDWITQGPKIKEFEDAIAAFTGVPHAVAMSNGTAALHAAMDAAGVGPGDEVIVPTITFAATSNAVVYQGGRPVFADVLPGNLLIDASAVKKLITKKTRAIVAVDYAGQPCDYDALKPLAREHGLVLISDACHSLGASYDGRPAGAQADMSVFSFHPVKPITTGEGGMVVTSDPGKAERLRIFRNHGIGADIEVRKTKGTWYYEMTDMGYNYRITDFQAALGLSQLKKLEGWIRRRQEIAALYDAAFKDNPAFSTLLPSPKTAHGYHLYVILLNLDRLLLDRQGLFDGLLNEGIKTNVHYLPVHLHPFYKKRFGYGPGLCPVAESSYPRLLSLPIFPSMEDAQIQKVIDTVLGTMQVKSFP